MKKLKICLLVLVLAAVAAVGIKYMNHSGKSNNEGDKNRYFDVTAIKQTEASTAEEQLLAASSIEKLNLSDYVDVADYEKIITITDRQAKTLNDEKENYSARRVLTDKILDAIVEDSEFTNIDSLVEEEATRLKVIQINKAADEGKSLDEYIEDTYSRAETFYSKLEEQAEKNVKYELVTYALCKELKIAPGDKIIIEEAECLAEYEGVETIEELIEMYGADYVRFMLLAYGDNGLREPLISANLKDNSTSNKSPRPRPTSRPKPTPTATPTTQPTPTPTPTKQPTPTPTTQPTPTPTPTKQPTPTPTTQPTPAPTTQPTPTPTTETDANSDI